MSAQVPQPSRSRASTPQTFPTRGVPGGWQDEWDADPIDAVLSALPTARVHRQSMNAAGVHIELEAHARADGRWEAYVVSGGRPRPASSFVNPKTSWPVVMSPPVNEPTAALALDTLEARLRALLDGSLLDPDLQSRLPAGQ
jgi:hypothetical protein